MKVSNNEYNAVRLKILRKLLMHGVVGAKHTSPDNLQKGLPGHLLGVAKEVAKDLIKEGILLSHPTSYGTQVSLNPDRLAEIKSALGI
jgi:hypothetical protein